MHDDDSDALHSLLEYLYTGDYEYTTDYELAAQATPLKILDRMQTVQKHVEIYMLAEKYDIASLKPLAQNRAKNAAEKISLDSSWDRL
jgi:hypothetical protein